MFILGSSLTGTISGAQKECTGNRQGRACLSILGKAVTENLRRAVGNWDTDRIWPAAWLRRPLRTPGVGWRMHRLGYTEGQADGRAGRKAWPSLEAAGRHNTTLLFKLSLLFSFSSFFSHCNLPCFGGENLLLCHYTFILKPYLSNKLFIFLRS